MAELVKLKNFQFRYEAEHAQALLKNNQIESFVSADDCGGFRPDLTIWNVWLLIKKEDFQKAKEVLAILED